VPCPADEEPTGPHEIVDPDVDLHDPAERSEPATPGRLPVLGAIAVGGVLGAEARYGLGVAWPHLAGNVPWATLVINVSGCVLIGVLMVLITERGPVHPLLRPLLGVGVLGGYTTFSTYAVDAVQLVAAGRMASAAGYVLATPVLAVLGVALGTAGARRLAPRVRR
jgi:CrcB protein